MTQETPEHKIINTKCWLNDTKGEKQDEDFMDEHFRATLLTIFQARFCFGRAEGLASPRCISRAGCSSAMSPTPEHGQNTLVAANCVFMEQNNR